MRAANVVQFLRFAEEPDSITAEYLVISTRTEFGLLTRANGNGSKGVIKLTKCCACRKALWCNGGDDVEICAV